MQRIEDEARLRFGTDQEVEAREGPVDEGIGDRACDRGGTGRCVRDGCGRGGGLGIEDRTGVRLQAEVPAGEIGLHAIGQGVVQRDLGDRRVDGDLELRLVDLEQRRFDNAVVGLVGIDQEIVVHGIGRDPHVLHHRLAVAGAGAASAVERGIVALALIGDWLLPAGASPPRPGPSRPSPIAAGCKAAHCSSLNCR